MIDYYLKAPDEAAMAAALIAAGAATKQLAELDDEGTVLAAATLLPAEGVLIDVIGTHYERTGGTDHEPEYSAVPGWHVNVRALHPIEWPEGVYTGQPHAPWRSWGGDPAVPPLAPASAPVATAQVDAERDRRISAGFEFQGVRYQSRLPSISHAGDWEVFSGKALEALIAVIAGAQPGDLRWSDPTEDFAWIAADNSRVPMDAQTVIDLAKAASAHRSRHTFAGSDLKAMEPIPSDFADGKWWP